MIRFAFITIIFFLAILNKGISQEIKVIKIGDKIPNIEVSHTINYLNEKLYIKDLLNNGPLIISFWATWCSPCIKEMKFLDSFIQKYPTLTVLAISYQDSSDIYRFFDKNKEALPKDVIIASNDTIFNKLFYHTTLPHNVWISKEGVVKAITSYDEINEKNLNDFIFGQVVQLPLKIDEPFDWKKPLNVPDSLLYFRSIFLPKIRSINVGGVTTNYSGLGIANKDRLLAFNLDRITLIWLAYTRNFRANVNYNLVELRVKDSVKYIHPELNPYLFSKSRYKNKTEWMNENLFFYELRFPTKVDDDTFYEFMQRDICHNLSVNVNYENQIRTCRVVTMDSLTQHKLIESNNNVFPSFRFLGNKLELRNISLDFLLNWIGQFSFDPNLNPITEQPLINETRLQNITLDIDLTNVKLNEWDSWQSCLEKYGFKFKSANRLYPVLIISE